jgi:hypothetical protein
MAPSFAKAKLMVHLVSDESSSCLSGDTPRSHVIAADMMEDNESRVLDGTVEATRHLESEETLALVGRGGRT